MCITGKNMDYEIRDAWVSFTSHRRLGNFFNIAKDWFPHLSSGNKNPSRGPSMPFTYISSFHLLDGNQADTSLLFSLYFGYRKGTLTTQSPFFRLIGIWMANCLWLQAAHIQNQQTWEQHTRAGEWKRSSEDLRRTCSISSNAMLLIHRKAATQI